MNYWLLDTGPMVAYLNRSDPVHVRVAACLDQFNGQLISTSAVITEAMYYVSGDPRGPRVCAEFISTSATMIYDFTQAAELQEAVALMERYADTPMDFADATLVLLAEGLSVENIITLDRRGFATYRTRQGKGFHLVLEQMN
jgi:predicted nucleic acid-binding protein